ncbi:hypothetical protein L596_025676 [Steinernema carpocapsae]|uniref:Uncharacterized protein n=1 Tax=Steinernema carpocapsae TaxID=34508 RepID=A0A4U5M8G1_STECR|nr:hypothetical protein L596_025676 [Steinernema carpocapsae]
MPFLLTCTSSSSALARRGTDLQDNACRQQEPHNGFLELKISCADKRRRRQQKEDNTLYEVDPKMPEKDFSEYKLLSDNEAFAKARIASKKSFMSK